jgi:hypothetical protein
VPLLRAADGQPDQDGALAVVAAVSTDIQVEMAGQVESGQLQLGEAAKVASHHSLNQIRHRREDLQRRPRAGNGTAEFAEQRRPGVRRPAEGVVERLQHVLVRPNPVQRQRGHNDVLVGPPSQVGQTFQRAAGNHLERLGIDQPTDPTGMEQSTVDIPQDQANRRRHELILTVRLLMRISPTCSFNMPPSPRLA